MAQSILKKETRTMRILALDLGKYKTVACDYEAETGRHRFVTIPTTPKALHDFMVDCEPDRVVIEICSIAGWVCDLVRTLGIILVQDNHTQEIEILGRVAPIGFCQQRIRRITQS